MLDTRTLRRIAAWIAVGGGLVGALGFALLAAMEGTSEAGARFAALDARWIATGAVVWTLALFIQGERWRALIPHEGPRPLEVGLVVAGTNVLNLALPGPVGEVVSAWYLKKRWGVPFAVAIGSEILARLLAMAILGILALGLAPWVPGGGPARGALALGLGLGGVFLGLVSGWPRRVLGLVDRLPLPRSLRGRVGWLRDTLGALGGLGARRWARAMGWAILNLAVLWVGVGTAFWAAGSEPRPLGLLLVHVLGSLGVVASVIFPGGLGTMEAIYVGLHGTLGVTVEEAVLGAVAIRWVQLGSMVLCLGPLLFVAREVGSFELDTARRELRALREENFE